MFPYNTNLQSQNLAWPQTTPGAIYYQQALNPYDSETFLNEVFSFNQQSIQAFKTLSHQLKLKFYLSVQQMKLLGYMSDKVGYQNIVSEIARRTVILKKPEKVEQKKKQQDLWGAKLEHLCEDHLKKLQSDNVLNGYQININTYNNEKSFNFNNGTTKTQPNNKNQQQQQFEWAQPTQQQQNKSHKLNGFKQDKTNKAFQSIQHAFSSIPNVQNLFNTQIKTQQKSHNNIPQQVLSFDSYMLYGNKKPKQKEQQKPAVPMQPIDVWDLQVIEDQPVKRLSIKNLQKSPTMNKSTSQVSSNDFQKGLVNYFGMQQPINQNLNININPQINSNPNINQSSSNNNNLQQIVKNTQKQSLTNSGVHSNTQITPAQYNPYSNGGFTQFITDNQSQNYKKNQTEYQMPNNTNTFNQPFKKQEPFYAQNKQNKKQNQVEDQDQFQWQQSTEVVADPHNTAHNGDILNSTQTNPNINLNPDTNFLTSIVNIQQPYTSIAPTVQNIPNNNFSFDFGQDSQLHKSLPEIGQSFSEPNQFFMSTIISNNNKQTSFDFGFDSNGGIDLSGFGQFGDLSSISSISRGQEATITQSQEYNQNMFPTTIGQDDNLFKKKKNEDEQDNEPISLSIPSAIYVNVDTSILEPLKRLPEVNTIASALKKKIFDFDRNFYQEALNLIIELGYEQNPDYAYMKQQAYICEQIFRLTEAYSAAVDQQQEQQIRLNFKQCKSLYSKLDTDRTAILAKKYLKMQGNTFSYQIGRLSLETGVPKQLIQKAINNPQFNNIATLLYLMVYFGSTYSISLYASQVIEYVNHIYEQMEILGKQVSQSTSQCKIIVKKNEKFVQYRDNLSKIANLAKRILLLGQYCVKDSLSPDLQTITQRLQSLFQKSYKQVQQIVPSYFLAFFADFACNKDNNVYTLHPKMTQFIDKHPLCCLCLQTVDNSLVDKKGQKRSDNKYYHYKCWNFKIKVTQYKNKLLQESSYKQEQPNSLYQNGQQQ